ncbi:MAG: hypothetical protein KBT85_15320, partial [Pseudomonas sp.]|nr:hypothetical protein [Pseudomonas sp.]
EIIIAIACAVGGIVLISGGLQGYLPKLGDLTERGLLHWPLRLGLIVGGLFLAMPHNPYILISEQTLFILSFGLIALTLALGLMHRRWSPA